MDQIINTQTSIKTVVYKELNYWCSQQKWRKTLHIK